MHVRRKHQSISCVWNSSPTWSTIEEAEAGTESASIQRRSNPASRISFSSSVATGILEMQVRRQELVSKVINLCLFELAKLAKTEWIKIYNKIRLRAELCPYYWSAVCSARFGFFEAHFKIKIDLLLTKSLNRPVFRP